MHAGFVVPGKMTRELVGAGTKARGERPCLVRRDGVDAGNVTILGTTAAEDQLVVDQPRVGEHDR